MFGLFFFNIFLSVGQKITDLYFFVFFVFFLYFCFFFFFSECWPENNRFVMFCNFFVIFCNFL